MSTRASQDLFDDFRPGPFETLDKPALVSHVFFLTLGAIFLFFVWKTPPRPIESLTIDQLPKRVSRLLLNQSDLAKLSAPERAAVPPAGIAPQGAQKTAEETPTEPEAHVSKQAPPPDARGVPTGPPGGGGGGSGAGSKGAAVAAGVAQQMAATGALAEVDRIVGDFTGVVASERGGRALRQGAAGSGIERRAGTPGAKARSGADLGGVDEILGKADQGGVGGRGTAGAGSGGGGGGVGRAQVRIAAPAPVAGGGDAAAEGRTAGALMAVVQRHAAAVRFCYNRLLTKKAGASGQIVIRLTVAGDGGVSEASVVRSSLGDADLDACVLGQAREWRFPPSSESRFVFDVPFVFTPPTDGSR